MNLLAEGVTLLAWLNFDSKGTVGTQVSSPLTAENHHLPVRSAPKSHWRLPLDLISAVLSTVLEPTLHTFYEIQVQQRTGFCENLTKCSSNVNMRAPRTASSVFSRSESVKMQSGQKKIPLSTRVLIHLVSGRASYKAKG